MANKKYLKQIFDEDGNSLWVDVYDVLDAFEVTCPATAHSVKKELNTGVRGHKSKLEDLIDIRDSAERAIRLEKNRMIRNMPPVYDPNKK